MKMKQLRNKNIIIHYKDILHSLHDLTNNTNLTKTDITCIKVLLTAIDERFENIIYTCNKLLNDNGKLVEENTLLKQKKDD